MDVGNSTNHVQNAADRGWRQVLGAQDAESVFMVLVTGWVTAAGALVFYYGKFNLILLLIAVGLITGVVVLSSGLALVSAIAVRMLSSRFKQG